MYIYTVTNEGGIASGVPTTIIDDSHSPIHTEPPVTSEAALPSIDLDSRRVYTPLRLPRGARELVERVPAELDHRRVVDRDHVYRRLAVVLQLPARAALRGGRAVDCIVRGRVSIVHARSTT